MDIEGNKIHYIDEGNPTNPVIVFVHGTPEWSFGFRDLIKGLSSHYRCVAMDHLGFGLSDKPETANYLVKKQAERLEIFIGQLNLKNINLVANDFGGGLALHYAIKHPDNTNRISIFNTWMWSLNQDKHYARPGKIIQSWFGRFLYKQLNFPVKVIMPKAYGNKSKLTKEIHRHFKAPLSKSSYRNATYTFAKELMNAGSWWDNHWNQLDTLKDKSFLIFWGMKDKFILPKELDKWLTKLPHAKVIRYENAGHFVQEEEPESMIRELNTFFSS